MPAAARGDDRISLFRPPTASFVRPNAVMGFEDRIDYRPCGLNRVFPREERAVAGHGVAEKPLVGRFVARPLFRHVELLLLSDEIFARELYAGSESTSRVRRERTSPPGRRTENAEPTAPFQQRRLRRGS